MENAQQFSALMCEAVVGASLGLAVTLVLVAAFRVCPVPCQAKLLRIMGRKL